MTLSIFILLSLFIFSLSLVNFLSFLAIFLTFHVLILFLFYSNKRIFYLLIYLVSISNCAHPILIYLFSCF